MARKHVETLPVAQLAVRRPEAAAALGISVETFDRHVRPNLPAVRLGDVTVYALADLQHFVDQAADTAPADLIRAVRRAA